MTLTPQFVLQYWHVVLSNAAAAHDICQALRLIFPGDSDIFESLTQNSVAVLRAIGLPKEYVKVTGELMRHFTLLMQTLIEVRSA